MNVGFGGGAVMLVGPIFIHETCQRNLHGPLTSCLTVMITLGIAFVNALNIGNFASWIHITIITTFAPILMAIAVLTVVPESPVYLATKGKETMALKVLERLGRHDPKSELESIQDSLKNRYDVDEHENASLFKSRRQFMPFFIVVILMLLQQLSGMNVILFYAQNIFSLAGTDFDPGKVLLSLANRHLHSTG